MYAPDLRGHGDSSWSTQGLYTPTALSEDLLSLVLELDLYVRPLVLVGIGLGGSVALTFASTHPALVESVCIVDSVPSVPVDSWLLHPLQAATFEGGPRRAVEALCAHGCWGHRPRKVREVTKYSSWWLKNNIEGAEPTALKIDPGWCYAYETEKLWVSERLSVARHPTRNREMNHVVLNRV